MVNDRIIQTDKIISMLEKHFFEIINNDDYYKGKKIKIANEQYFVRDKEPGVIYIVFKLGTTDINYGQSSLPITLVAISERNGVNLCQNLLIDFVEKYNLQWNENKTIKEFWKSPTVISNFEEIYDGFRSTLYTTGTFLITENTNFFDVYYSDYYLESNNKELEKNELIKNDFWFEKKINENNMLDKKITYNGDGWYLEEEKINLSEYYVDSNFVANQDDFIIFRKKWILIDSVSTTTGADVNSDSQVFYNSNNFADSIGMYGTKVMSLSMYSFDDKFCNKCLDIYLEDLESQPDGIDTKFELKLKFKNGKEKEDYYKMISYKINSNLGDIPIISLSFVK